ncbi:MAG: metal-dependent hydrolase [Pirellulales bacterium]
MADFQTHITTSTVLGIAGGLAAHAFYDVPLSSCVLAGGLCSIAGMMPDLDSDSGVPLRESVAFAAAVLPMMMVERFAKWGFSFESLILVSAVIYLVVRFGAAEFLKRYTVHRGMFHSLPAAVIAGELAFLIFDNENVALRFLNAGAVMTGYLSHLILDELWSIDVNWGLVRFKKSFGSALKFWGDGAAANLGCYAVLIVLTLAMTGDPAWSNYVEPWMDGRLRSDGFAVANGEAWRKNLFHKSYDGIPLSAYDHPWNRIPVDSRYAPASNPAFWPTTETADGPITGNPYGLRPATQSFVPQSIIPPMQYGQDPYGVERVAIRRSR